MTSLRGRIGSHLLCWTLSLLAGANAVAADRSIITPVPVTPQPTNAPGVTSVTQEPHVNADMGLKMVPVNEQGDSQFWWERRQAGWDRYLRARRQFSRAKSPTAELYLNALAEGFNRAIEVTPQTRFHFYVADTLNPSLWPVGGGFFIVHAGLFRLMRDERQFTFLLALELAHEVLGHNMMPLRAGDVKWEPGRWRDGDYDAWPIEFWAALVGNDPLVRGGFRYSLQQESDALELVYRFFRANAWEYDGINRLVADLLPRLNEIPGSSSLEHLHENLAQAIRLPHLRPEPLLKPVDSLVNRATYQRIVAEIGASTLQHYAWLLELVPYRDFVVERNLNIDEVREGYNPHAAIVSKKIVTATRKTRQVSLATELDELASRNDDFDARDKLISARMARIYLRGMILLAHHRWEDAIASANEGLKLNASAEPFFWQRAIARQQLGQFKRCTAEMPTRWSYFDSRRELIVVENEFLEGRYTEAARHALDYRNHYPFDIDGAFWEALAEIRLRRRIDKTIDDVEAFWGERPMVRALKVFYYGYLGKLGDAEAAVDFTTDIPYLAYEWGILEFAQAWLRQTFDVYHADDERSEKLLQLSELQWPLSRLVRYNLPRDAVQKR